MAILKYLEDKSLRLIHIIYICGITSNFIQAEKSHCENASGTGAYRLANIEASHNVNQMSGEQTMKVSMRQESNRRGKCEDWKNKRKREK